MLRKVLNGILTVHDPFVLLIMVLEKSGPRFHSQAAGTITVKFLSTDELELEWTSQPLLN